MNKKRVLIVEDESIVALDIHDRLSNLGYEIVDIAATGKKAIDLALKHKPDLILMDVHLRGEIDGIETASQIKDQLDVPIVFLTAFADENTLERAMLTEPFGYIIKPFEERELVVAIETALYKHRMEKALRESEERYMLALRGSNDGVWDWDLRSDTVYFSNRWKEMVGYEGDEFDNSMMDWFALIHEEDLPGVKTAIDSHIAGLSPHLEIEHRMLHSKGHTLWVLTRGMAVRDQDGTALRMSGSLTDITRRKTLENQLVHNALHDNLTGLPNRTLLTDRLERRIERSKRQPHEVYAVLFLDLDRFKLVNDTRGHHAGDLLIKIIAERLSGLLRASDTAARIGGDEFVILLENLARPEDAILITERILKEIELPIPLDGEPIEISGSIGIVISTDNYQNANDLLRDADIAMYRAKARGKALYEIFKPELRDQLLNKIEIENILRKAIQEDSFPISYQPVVSLNDSRIVGFEALFSWKLPGHEDLSEKEVMKIAEETGLWSPIGKSFIRRACKQFSQWQSQSETLPLSFSLNLSARQFSEPQLAEYILSTLQETGLKPGVLSIEITERNFITREENAQRNLSVLSDAGIKVTIEGFGNGYVTLGSSQGYELLTIKIDQTFIQDIENNETKKELVLSIMKLAKEMKAHVVADGIETEEQQRTMKDLGCMYGQGSLFYQPLGGNGINVLLSSLTDQKPQGSE